MVKQTEKSSRMNTHAVVNVLRCFIFIRLVRFAKVAVSMAPIETGKVARTLQWSYSNPECPGRGLSNLQNSGD